MNHSLSFPQKWSFILIVICGHYNNVAVNIHIYAVNIHIYMQDIWTISVEINILHKMMLLISIVLYINNPCCSVAILCLTQSGRWTIGSDFY